MTIGPEPMMRIEWMSVRLGISRSGHELAELLEQVAGVMRARARLGVVLHAERRDVAAPQPLDDAVVEVDVGDVRRWERSLDDCVVVVLARDLDRARLE